MRARSSPLWKRETFPPSAASGAFGRSRPGGTRGRSSFSAAAGDSSRLPAITASCIFRMRRTESFHRCSAIPRDGPLRERAAVTGRRTGTMNSIMNPWATASSTMRSISDRTQGRSLSERPAPASFEAGACCLWVWIPFFSLHFYLFRMDRSARPGFPWSR